MLKELLKRKNKRMIMMFTNTYITISLIEKSNKNNVYIIKTGWV